MTRVIIGIGSNHDAETSVAKAKALIEASFGKVAYSHAAYTEPVDIVSDKFLNVLALATTELDTEAIDRILKQIERECGNTPSLRQQNIVAADLDILLCGEQRMHLKDWTRPYVVEMYKELENK